MGRYVIRRLLQMIPVFIGATLLIFLMVNVMGDPIAGLCGDRQCDPATAAQLRREFGLDKPVWQQYLTYMGHVFSGDFGTAFNGQKVIDLMADGVPGHHPADDRGDPLRESSSASRSAWSPACAGAARSTPPYCC